MEIVQRESTHQGAEAEIIRQSVQARMTGLKWSIFASLGAVLTMIVAILSK
jgi:hypothetical protein